MLGELAQRPAVFCFKHSASGTRGAIMYILRNNSQFNTFTHCFSKMDTITYIIGYYGNTSHFFYCDIKAFLKSKVRIAPKRPELSPGTGHQVAFSMHL